MSTPLAIAPVKRIAEPKRNLSELPTLTRLLPIPPKTRPDVAQEIAAKLKDGAHQAPAPMGAT